MLDERPPFRLARAGGQRRDIQAQRVQRLAQIVACRGKQLALGAIRRFRCGTRFECGAGALLQFTNQVYVLVPDDERARQYVVQPVTEPDNEQQHDAHHAGDEEMDLVADQRDAHDQRHEGGQHEAIERWLVHCRQVQSAERGAEQADDQQCLVRRRLREKSSPPRVPTATRPAWSPSPSSVPSAAPPRRPGACARTPA